MRSTQPTLAKLIRVVAHWAETHPRQLNLYLSLQFIADEGPLPPAARAGAVERRGAMRSRLASVATAQALNSLAGAVLTEVLMGPTLLAMAQLWATSLLTAVRSQRSSPVVPRLVEIQPPARWAASKQRRGSRGTRGEAAFAEQTATATSPIGHRILRSESPPFRARRRRHLARPHRVIRAECYCKDGPGPVLGCPSALGQPGLRIRPKCELTYAWINRWGRTNARWLSAALWKLRYFIYQNL